MKFQIQLFVPDASDNGVLALDKTVDGILAALKVVDMILREPEPPVERSMLRVQAVAQSPDVVLILFVRNGAWEPVRHAFSFRR